MSNTYKICLFFSMIILFFVIGGFSVVHGEGYFLEKGEELFVFDNLYINGYLVVENQINLDNTGLPGDVLVEGDFILADDSNFYFCSDDRLRREGYPLLAQNTDCSNKVMIWYPDANNGLLVLNNDYQIEVNRILVDGDAVNLQAVGNIKTDKPVYVKNGCFSNDGVACNLGELRTNLLFLDNLENLESVNSRNEISIVAQEVQFNSIKFDKDYDLNRQSICFKKGFGVTCSSFGAVGNASMTNTTFLGSYPATKSGAELCCFLNITGF